MTAEKEIVDVLLTACRTEQRSDGSLLPSPDYD